MCWTVPMYTVEDKASPRAMLSNGIQINSHGVSLGDLNPPVNVYNLLDVVVANIKVASLPVPNPGGKAKALSRILLSPRARAKEIFHNFQDHRRPQARAKEILHFRLHLLYQCHGQGTCRCL